MLNNKSYEKYFISINNNAYKQYSKTLTIIKLKYNFIIMWIGIT